MSIGSFVDVIDHGTYFFPAWKHYGREVNVICDRCATSNLPACIGFNTRDLCLPCVTTLTSNICSPLVPFPQMHPPISPHWGAMYNH